MPEILTESFCERCGTRYTFESAAPRKTRRLGQIKTLSKGMKNWVMSDDTSLDEAMAAARNDDERELTSHQLDAFHSTFNFCMTCRQYTCGNCWNAAEGRCLTCAPHLGQEVLPAPFPDQAAFEPVRIEAEAWPEIDLSAPGQAASNGNGNGHARDAHSESTDPWGGAADIGEIPEIDPAARLAFLSGETPTPVLEPEPMVAGPLSADTLPDPWPAQEGATDWGAAAAGPDSGATADADDAVPANAAPVGGETPISAPIWKPTFLGNPATADPTETSSPAVEPVAAAESLSADPAPAIAGTGQTLPPTVEGRADLGTSRTADLLKRFRPGQNIDAEIAAFEAGLDANSAVAGAELVAAAATVSDGQVGVDEPVAAEPVAAAESPTPVTAAEPVAAEPKPALPLPAMAAPDVTEAPAVADAAAATEAPGPAAAPVTAPEPVAAVEPRTDHVPQPTWQIFAPDAGQPAAPAAPVAPIAPAAPGAPAQPPGVPQWPVRPDQVDSPAMALLADREHRSSSDALWAASAQEVLSRPAAVPVAGAPAGVQPCSSCGLSLSATARFCRRCGTRQG